MNNADLDRPERDLSAVQRRYGAPIFWVNDAGLHACGGTQLHPGVFLLWPICGKGDVPAGKGFKSPDAKVSCPDCIAALKPEPAL